MRYFSLPGSYGHRGGPQRQTDCRVFIPQVQQGEKLSQERSWGQEAQKKLCTSGSSAVYQQNGREALLSSDGLIFSLVRCCFLLRKAEFRAYSPVTYFSLFSESSALPYQYLCLCVVSVTLFVFIIEPTFLARSQYISRGYLSSFEILLFYCLREHAKF